MNNVAKQLIISYGQSLIQLVTGIKNETQTNWRNWEVLLSYGEDASKFPVVSIWSQLSTIELDKTILSLPIQAVNLSAMEQDDRSIWTLFPDKPTENFVDESRALGEQFRCKGGFKETNFDRFYGLMQKYTSTLPCTYGEPGVSLFRQWTMMAALMALSPDGTPEDVPDKLALIGIDLPGIQSTIYTIASRGAGKTVRGRSAFVQLLVNAIVDRLVYQLNLCRANVIVNAGGNATLVCAWSDELMTTLNTIEYEINNLLFKGNDQAGFSGFAGDLALALTAIEMPRSALAYSSSAICKDRDGSPISEWQFYEDKLKEKLNQVKQQPFASLLKDEQALSFFFEPDPTFSSVRCAVCHRPQPDGTPFESNLYENDSEFEPEHAYTCAICNSFRELATVLGQWDRDGNGVFLNRQRKPSKTICKKVWQNALFAITDDGQSGYCYQIARDPYGELSLALSPDDFPADGCHGYWPMATTTPQMNNEDVQNARARGDNQAEVGNIRDNEMIASDSPSTFKRIGILKADVDSLGALLRTGLNNRSAAQTATLSESLTLFFGGWLDKICQEDTFRKKVYILYAGGDDLLIIGTWNVIPLLAKRIADDFRRYTGHNPSVHLSAGISIVGGKEPLYAAIDAADKALDKAKAHTEDNVLVKDAIGFMEQTHSWAAFNEIVTWQERLYELRKSGVPSSLFMNLLSIYEQYMDDQRAPEDKRGRYTTQAKKGTYHHKDADKKVQSQEIHMGPWMWQMFYRLKRLEQRGVQSQDVEDMIKQLLSPNGIERLALSARWAQLLSREKN